LAFFFGCFKIGPEHIIDLVGLGSGQTQGKQQFSAAIFELEICTFFPFCILIFYLFKYFLGS